MKVAQINVKLSCFLQKCQIQVIKCQKRPKTLRKPPLKIKFFKIHPTSDPHAFFNFLRVTKKMSFSKFLYIKGQLLRKARRGAHIYVKVSLSFQKVLFFDDLGLKFLKKKFTTLFFIQLAIQKILWSSRMSFIYQVYLKFLKSACRRFFFT